MIETEINSPHLSPLQFAVVQKALLIQDVMTLHCTITSDIVHLSFSDAPISLCCMHKLSQKFVAYTKQSFICWQYCGLVIWAWLDWAILWFILPKFTQVAAASGSADGTGWSRMISLTSGGWWAEGWELCFPLLSLSPAGQLGFLQVAISKFQVQQKKSKSQCASTFQASLALYFLVFHCPQ